MIAQVSLILLLWSIVGFILAFATYWQTDRPAVRWFIGVCAGPLWWAFEGLWWYLNKRENDES